MWAYGLGFVCGGQAQFELSKLMVCQTYVLWPGVAKALAIYRIEKPRNPENRRQIGNIWEILCFAYFGSIFPIFCLFFSYFLHLGVFPFCRWPRLLQTRWLSRKKNHENNEDTSDGREVWTDTGVDQNFQRDLGAIGPNEFQGNSPPLPCFQRNAYGPMAHKVRQKFPPRDWYWSMDGSSQVSQPTSGSHGNHRNDGKHRASPKEGVDISNLVTRRRVSFGNRERGVPGSGQKSSWNVLRFLRVEICYYKGILTRHFACYSDVGFEDKSVIWKTPLPKPPPFDFPESCSLYAG